MKKTILMTILVTISAINAFAGGRSGDSSGRTQSVSSYTRANGTVVQSYMRHPAGSGSGTTPSTRMTGAGYSPVEGVTAPSLNNDNQANTQDGKISLLYYNSSELADKATYKANIKSGKWHPFKNGE